MSAKASASAKSTTLIDETNAYIKRQFQAKLIEIFESVANASEGDINEQQNKLDFANNIWILNDIVIPFTGNGPQLNFFRLKYSPPENYLATYSSFNKTILSTINEKLIENAATNQHIKNFSLNINRSHLFEPNSQAIGFSKHNIITHFACNKQGKKSAPLVLLPRSIDLESDLSEHALSYHLHFEEIANGSELNELKSFIEWVKRFVEDLGQDKTQQPIVLILNVYFYYLLFLNVKEGAESLLDELVTYCEINRIYLLFFPLETQSNVLNRNIHKKFQEEWTPILEYCGARRNPYAQTTLIMIYNQVMRLMFPSSFHSQADYVHDLMYECLNEMFRVNEINDDLLDKCGIGECLKKKSLLKDVETNDEDMVTGDDGGEEGNENSKSLRMATLVRNFSLTPSDADELVAWIDGMSDIGSLCIKYTFLKELYVRQRVSLLQPIKNGGGGGCAAGSSKYKESLANEKRWVEFVKKNRAIFKTKHSCGLNESNYLHRWLDNDLWYMSYYNYVKQNCKITSPDSLWTFDIIQFPYLPGSGILKAPENEYSKRPLYSKPRISVLFAFSASGDYLTPFIVYPENFKHIDGDEPISSDNNIESNANECFAPNGYITCRIFEAWLTKLFLPYLSQKKANCLSSYLLLFCGKLSVIDTHNFKLCTSLSKPRVNLFAFSSEQQMPFNVLFQKTVRKRQVDLFHDSWSKCTAKLNLSFQFRCKNRAQFFNLFTDAFQNCIEEVGNKEDNLNTSSRVDIVATSTSFPSSQNDSVLNFKNKMIKSFEQCHLWPLNSDEYKVYSEAAKKKLEEMEKASAADDDMEEDEGVGVGEEEDEEEDVDEEMEEEVEDGEEEDGEDKEKTHIIEDLENQPPAISADTVKISKSSIRKKGTFDSTDDDEEFQPKKKRARVSSQVNTSRPNRRHSMTTMIQPPRPITPPPPLVIVPAKRGRKSKATLDTTVSTPVIDSENITIDQTPLKVTSASLETTSTVPNLNDKLNETPTPVQNKRLSNRPDTPAPKEITSSAPRRNSVMNIKRFSFDSKAKLAADSFIASQMEDDNEVKNILDSNFPKKVVEETTTNQQENEVREASPKSPNSSSLAMTKDTLVRDLIAILIDKNNQNEDQNPLDELLALDDVYNQIKARRRLASTKDDPKYEETYYKRFGLNQN